MLVLLPVAANTIRRLCVCRTYKKLLAFLNVQLCRTVQRRRANVINFTGRMGEGMNIVWNKRKNQSKASMRKKEKTCNVFMQMLGFYTGRKYTTVLNSHRWRHSMVSQHKLIKVSVPRLHINVLDWSLLSAILPTLPRFNRVFLMKRTSSKWTKSQNVHLANELPLVRLILTLSGIFTQPLANCCQGTRKCSVSLIFLNLAEYLLRLRVSVSLASARPICIKRSKAWCDAGLFWHALCASPGSGGALS